MPVLLPNVTVALLRCLGGISAGTGYPAKFKIHLKIGHGRFFSAEEILKSDHYIQLFKKETEI
jgi:hypothetical protein